VVVVVMAVRMIVAVIVPATAIGTMFVMVVMVVAVMMSVRMRGGFCTASGIERRFDMRDARAETFRQCFQRRIAGYADMTGEKLHRHMAIAELPGDAREVFGTGGNFSNRLACGNHADNAAVFEFQAIAIAKHPRSGGVEQKNRVVCAPHGNTAAMAAIMRQLDRVDFVRLLPMAGRKHFSRADHFHVLGAQPGTL
jgi:hypothetical protein